MMMFVDSINLVILQSEENGGAIYMHSFSGQGEQYSVGWWCVLPTYELLSGVDAQKINKKIRMCD